MTVEVAVCVEVALAVTVTVGVAVEVGVAVTVWVAVLVLVKVAVGVEVGVALAVSVAVAVGVLDARAGGFLILICCEAAKVFPWVFNSAVRSYWPGTSVPMLSVMTEDDGLGWTESESTVRPFWPRILSSNRHWLSGVPADGRTLIPTWTICD